MCRPDQEAMKTKQSNQKILNEDETNSDGAKSRRIAATKGQEQPQKRRRGKRDKDGEHKPQLPATATTTTTTTVTTTTTTIAAAPTKKKKKKKSKALKKHGKDNPSGGLESLIPSLIGVSVLVMAVMAQRGFRGRASVAGIDLGTTNSVICVQRPSKGVGIIDCVEDPLNGSPIIPSVVSVYDPIREAGEIKVGPSSKTKTLLHPHPTKVVVGHAAKRRIDTHPHQTLFNAKRVLGRPFEDVAVEELKQEVEFTIEREAERPAEHEHETPNESSSLLPLESVFRVDDYATLSPQQIGGHVVNFLIGLTRDFLGHDNVKSAVLAVPAKFDAHQRRRTYEAFQLAGIKVARVLEEPTAAALAYGLHKKEGVEKILVYDFVSIIWYCFVLPSWRM